MSGYIHLYEKDIYDIKLSGEKLNIEIVERIYKTADLIKELHKKKSLEDFVKEVCQIIRQELWKEKIEPDYFEQKCLHSKYKTSGDVRMTVCENCKERIYKLNLFL